MKRVLVVVDGSIESGIAIEYAIELATVTGGIELLLLNVRSPAPAWQARTTRPDKEIPPAKRILSRAARLSKMAGVPYRERSEEGEIPETVIRIAREEPCDLIVWPERGMGPVARAVLMLTGFSANAFVNKIISTSPVPVTVVTDSTARQMRPYHEVH
jgi:nucleotide-binding universal stress UspA family protein